MPDIEFLQPTTLEEAIKLLAQYGEEAHVLAGGTFLTLLLKQGFIAPRALVSLHRIPGLRHIQERPDEGLCIGALVTHREVETSALVKQRYSLLAETYAQVANVRVRNQATVGGNLADADYASDPPASLTALDAHVRITGPNGQRTVPVRDFIIGHYQTVLEPGEIITEVVVPPPAPDVRSTYVKFRTRSSEDRPCASVAVALRLENGRCQDLRVVVGAVADRPQVVDEALALARGQALTEALIGEIAGAYASAIEPLSDLRGSAWYRTQIIEVLVRRAIHTLVD